MKDGTHIGADFVIRTQPGARFALPYIGDNALVSSTASLNPNSAAVTEWPSLPPCLLYKRLDSLWQINQFDDGRDAFLLRDEAPKFVIAGRFCRKYTARKMGLLAQGSLKTAHTTTKALPTKMALCKFIISRPRIAASWSEKSNLRRTSVRPV